MKTKSFIFPILVCLLFFTSGTAARAHPADVYAHAIHITISQSNLQIEWEIKPGPMLTSYLWYEADLDQDGTLNQQEVDTWGRVRAALLTATLDDKPLPLLIESVQMPTDLQSFQAGEEFITFTLSAKLLHPQGAASIQQLVLNNGMEQKTSINWFYLSTAENTAFLFPAQKNNTVTIDIVQDRTLVTDQSKLLSSWDSGTPSLPAGQKQDVVTETAQLIVPELAKNSPQEILLNLVRAENFSISFYVFALAISLALGALHALTPGHGKTVVAAYLVGSRGTTKHAIALGSIVTLTHTGSVFIIGLFTLAASQYILPTTIIPILEILSGLLIVGLGLYLFWQRFLYWRTHASAAVPGGYKVNLAPSPAQGATYVRKYSLTPSSSTGRKISGAYKIQKLPGNYHDHGDGHSHSHEVPESITWRSLITLGISGGLVPCPDAIAILLVAIAINRILLGLALIISFSLGLAVVLIVIGLLMVNSSRLFTRMDAFNKLAPIMPIVSAAIVLILGLGLTYGAISKLGSFPSMAGAGSKANEAQVIYLNADENKHKQLFIVDTQGSDPLKLTNTANDVVDFSISPDQKQVIYIEQTEDIEYNLWLMNLSSKENHLVISCKTAICGQPIWSPDGNHVVYEYTELDGGASSLWWFDVASGKAQPVFQEERLPGTNPRWSLNGEWLSYATPEGIRLYQLESGESRLIENILGAAVQWSPDSESILLRDVLIRQDQFITQLFLYDLSSETITNLNANENMENILAAWSPDGEFIAVVRRDLSIPRGDQIWLMRADGSEAHVITDMPAVLHGSLNWSPDGKYILYDLYLLDSFPLESQLEMVNIETGEVTKLGVIGYNPKWVWQK